MPLFRLLALALLIWVAYLVLRNFLKRVKQIPGKPQSGAKGTKVGKIVRCQKCGVHFPENEAIRKNGKIYCCEEHSR